MLCWPLLRWFRVIKVPGNWTLSLAGTPWIRSRRWKIHPRFDGLLHFFQIPILPHEIIKFPRILVLSVLFLLALIPYKIISCDYFFSTNLQFIWSFDLNKVTFWWLHMSPRRFGHRWTFFWFLMKNRSLKVILRFTLRWLVFMTMLDPLHKRITRLIHILTSLLSLLLCSTIMLRTLLQCFLFLKLRDSILMIAISSKWVNNSQFPLFSQHRKHKILIFILIIPTFTYTIFHQQIITIMIIITTQYMLNI